MAYDEQLAERIRGLMAARRGMTERKMMGGLTFMNPKGMFCSASGKGGLLVRVDPASRDKFLGEAHAEPADIGGRRMTGFLRVRPEGYRTDANLKKWIERGLAAIEGHAAAAPKRSGLRAAAAKPQTAKTRRTRRGK